MLFFVTLFVAVAAFDITTSNITNVASSPHSRFTVVRIVVSPKTSNVMATPNATSSESQHHLTVHKHKPYQRNIPTSSIAIPHNNYKSNDTSRLRSKPTVFIYRYVTKTFILPYTNTVPSHISTFKAAPTLDVYTQKKNTSTSSTTEPQAILETKTWVSIASDIVVIIYRLVDTLLTIYNIKIVMNILGGNCNPRCVSVMASKLIADLVSQRAHAARPNRLLWYGQTP